MTSTLRGVALELSSPILGRGKCVVFATQLWSLLGCSLALWSKGSNLTSLRSRLALHKLFLNNQVFLPQSSILLQKDGRFCQV